MRFYFYLFLLIFQIQFLYGQFGDWTIADSLIYPRQDHASVKLPNGNILVTGGIESPKKSEIYDYQMKKWIEIDSMKMGRFVHHLIALNNDKVFAIGGFKNRSCEIYDPQLDEWEVVDSIEYRSVFGSDAILLADGRVILTGGYYDPDTSIFNISLNRSEIFNPQLNEWETTNPMNVARYGHKNIALNDSSIMVIGGYTKTCEVFNLNTQTWTIVDSLSFLRAFHTANKLPDGKIIVTGGNGESGLLNKVEIYDPIIEAWFEVTPLMVSRETHNAIVISDSLMLIFGGGINYNVWEIFDFKNYSNTYVNYNYPFPKNYQTGHLLPDASVISIGGITWTGSLPQIFASHNCEIYNPYITSIKENYHFKTQPFELQQNYPNPFNSLTTIPFYIYSSGDTEITICDISGKIVETLHNGWIRRGTHRFSYNALNLSSGVYFYSLKTRDAIKTKKFLLIK